MIDGYMSERGCEPFDKAAASLCGGCAYQVAEAASRSLIRFAARAWSHLPIALPISRSIPLPRSTPIPSATASSVSTTWMIPVEEISSMPPSMAM